MKASRRDVLYAAACAVAGFATAGSTLAQTPTPARKDYSGNEMVAPPKGYYPYSGVSGPGFPLTAASAHGGWRSGSTGLAYKGEHPPSFLTLPFDGEATGSAVKQNLIPPLMPLLEVQVRDTVLCRGGDGHFYMTGSTGQNIWAFNDGVELWRSHDLESWHYLGLVWSIEKEGGWEKQWRSLHGKPSRSIWAPEIHFVKGNYYICLSMAPSGISILRSTTGKATGPYRHCWSPDAPVCGGIDPTLFEDTDGTVYFTWSSATRIVRMKDDMNGFAEPFRAVQFVESDHTPTHHSEKCIPRGSNDIGHEGAVLFKHNGRYYLGAADEFDGRYSTMLTISDNIYGPYRIRHESVPCGGGTGFFQDKKGNWWSSYFGNDNQSPFREKPAIVRVDFAADGRVVVAKGS